MHTVNSTHTHPAQLATVELTGWILEAFLKQRVVRKFRPTPKRIQRKIFLAIIDSFLVDRLVRIENRILEVKYRKFWERFCPKLLRVGFRLFPKFFPALGIPKYFQNRECFLGNPQMVKFLEPPSKMVEKDFWLEKSFLQKTSDVFRSYRANNLVMTWHLLYLCSTGLKMGVWSQNGCF